MTRLRSLTLHVALVLSAGCSARQRVATETAVAEVLISDQQEQALGLQVHQELDKKGVKYLEDPVVVGYVQGIVDKLALPARRDRKDVRLHLHVIDDAKTVNAFATPGGHLYVYTALLSTADSEAEVAGVLAHEIGHVVGRHSARQMVHAYGLEAIASLALGKNPGLLQQVVAGVAANGLLLAHGRGEESEADDYAVRYTSAVGYDPKGIAVFFGKLLQKQGRTPQVLTWLSTHAATEDRIAHVNEVIAREGLGGTETGAERLAPIKQRLGGAK